jgi:hypothetical protein
MKKFYDMWARWNGPLSTRAGKIGAAKKAGVMWGLGVVAGVPVGAAGSVILGPILGGALGAVVARSVARSLAAAKFNKEAGAGTVALAQSRHEYNEVRDNLQAIHDRDEYSVAADISNRLVEGNEAEVHRGRRRVALSAGIAAVGGAIGAGVAEKVGDIISGNGGGDKLQARGKGFGKPDLDGPELTPETPDIPASADNSYPWDYMSGRPDVGPNAASDTINELADQARAEGWIVNGSIVPGDNNDSFNLAVSPDGRLFASNGEKNGVLAYWLSKYRS